MQAHFAKVMCQEGTMLVYIGVLYTQLIETLGSLELIYCMNATLLLLLLHRWRWQEVSADAVEYAGWGCPHYTVFQGQLEVCQCRPSSAVWACQRRSPLYGVSREMVIEDAPVNSSTAPNVRDWIGSLCPPWASELQRRWPYSSRTSIQVLEAPGSQCASHPQIHCSYTMWEILFHHSPNLPAMLIHLYTCLWALPK